MDKRLDIDMSLPTKIKYVARNKNGMLYGYHFKPRKSKKEGRWINFLSTHYCYIQTCGFKDVKWEDKNPTCINK